MHLKPLIFLALIAVTSSAHAETRSECRQRIDKQLASIDARMRQGHYGNGNSLRERRNQLSKARYECRKLPAR